MHSLHKRRVVLLAAGLASSVVLAVAGGPSPAVAYTIWGSGAAVQKSVQSVWIKDKAPSTVIYTATNSEAGSTEFGNGGAGLDPKQDPTGAGAQTPAQLDAFTGVDSPPSKTEQEAAGTAAESALSELSIPVGQTSLALILSAPTGITLNTSQKIELTNEIASKLYAGEIPPVESGKFKYAKNTWGAFLVDVGLKPIESGSPEVGQFLDGGGATGGNQAIQVEVRADGAGATLVLKQYLDAAESKLWSGAKPEIPIDEKTKGTNEWPKGTTPVGFNTSDSNEATATLGNPGSVGYVTTAAASAAGFTSTPTTTATGGSHQIHYAQLQDGTKGVHPTFADPENSGAANIYTGSDINVNNAGSGAGNWIVPNTSETFNPTGAWTTNNKIAADYTHAWDLKVYNDTNSESNYYPLNIVIWALAWTNKALLATNRLTALYTTPKQTELSIANYLQYVTSPNIGGSTAATSGQFAEQNGGIFFAQLPTGGTGLADIQKDASLAAAQI